MSSENEKLVAEFKKLVSLIDVRDLRISNLEKKLVEKMGGDHEAKILVTDLKNSIKLNLGGVKIAKSEREIFAKLDSSKKESFESHWHKLQKEAVAYPIEDCGD